MGCGWKLDSENLAYAAVVLFYTRELTTGTAFGSVDGNWADRRMSAYDAVDGSHPLASRCQKEVDVAEWFESACG